MNENVNEYIIYKNQKGEEIKIIDNFFSDTILKQITDYFDNIDWKCQCIKDENTNLYTDNPYWRIELENVTFFNFFLKNIIEKYFNKKLHLKRVYVVGQTYGQDSNFHIDDNAPNTYTFCFYINGLSKINDDGLFHLKIPNETHIIIVEPIMNRAVIFPCGYRHKGGGLNRFNNNHRICIAWKFEIL